MEIILLDKYLVRTDEYNFRLATVKKGKEPIVTIKDGKRDYSNFRREIYPSTFSQCLRWIKEFEIKNSDVTDVDELKQLIDEIDKKIEQIRRKFL